METIPVETLRETAAAAALRILSQAEDIYQRYVTCVYNKIREAAENGKSEYRVGFTNTNPVYHRMNDLIVEIVSKFPGIRVEKTSGFVYDTNVTFSW